MRTSQRWPRVLLTVMLVVATMALSAPVASGRHAQPGFPVLRRGDHLQAVALVQSLLSDRGFRVVADARFGPQTEDAVRRFQSSSKLRVDGIVGNQTWSHLIRTLRQGSRGDAVYGLQRNLRQHQGYEVAVDGVFGPQTRQAVLQFQTDTGLVADGIVGPKTWQMLADRSVHGD